MTRATFFKHFELLADQPDAVARMRELVLQLAVGGQLVAQSSKDESANNLVERARKAWSERKIRDRQRSDPQSPPYSLPSSWTWTCLDEIGDTNPRNEADDELEIGFVPMKLISAQYGEPVSFEIQRWGEVKKGFTHFADGDVVLAKITPCFENGKSAVISKLKNGIGAGTTELHVFRQYSRCVVPDYVLIYFKTPRFINDGVPRMTGSAGQKRVPWDYFANTPFPLPPLAEQRRIVAKVDELMALCDELEQRQQARQHARGQLHQSALHHLLAAREPQTFAGAWQRTRDHFHLLHDTPDSIPQLRQAILQLAVQGRLVRQNPKEGNADETFALIQMEKIKLGEKRRTETPERPPQACAPHEVPGSWKWTTVDDVSLKITDGEHLSPKKASEGMFLLTAKHIRDEGISFADPQYVSLEDGSRFRIRCGPTRGDVLICSRGTIGRCAVVETDEVFCLMGSVILVRPSSFVIPSFLACFLKTDWAQKKMTGMSGATAVNALYLKDLRYCPIPLPPLAEQKRIVARVEELLRWCDTLEAQLHQTRTLGAHLLDSTLHHLLAAWK